MVPLSLKKIWVLLEDSFEGFAEDKVFKLGSSLAYFTIFSIGPMLLVVIFLAGLFLGRQAVEGSLYTQIEQFVGADAALQLQHIIKNASTTGGGKVAAIIGIIMLLIGATTVFAEIQDSINTIWHIKLNPNHSWLHQLINRLLSFGLITSMGFLLLVSLAAAAFIEGLGDKLTKLVPGFAVPAFYLASQVVTLMVAFFLFALIFKILPAAIIRWKDVWPGAMATAFLFMVGRFAISFYISQSNFGNTYGAASSLVVLLVWIYYSSLILYFGAEFTKAYTTRFGKGMQLKSYALWAINPVMMKEKN